jgi:PAS domain S-box-containing protein
MTETLAPTAPVSTDELISKLEKVQKLQLDLTSLISALHRVALVAETDADGKFVFVNDLFCQTSGYEPHELIGKNFSILKSGHQNQALFDELWKTITAGKVWHGRFKNKTKDGQYFWVESTIIPQLNTKNQIKKFISISFNISQVMETGYQTPKLHLLPAYSPLSDAAAQQVLALQQQLQTAQNEYLALKKATDASVMVSETDKRGIITAVNDLFAFNSGYLKHELIGQNHRLLKSETMPSETYDELWRVISNGQVWRGLLENKTKSGRLYTIDCTITPITGTDGKVERYIAVSHDVTEWLHKSAQSEDLSEQTLTELAQLRGEVEQLKTYNHELEELQTLLYSQVTALHNSALVAEMNLEGHFLFVNDHYAQVSGYSRDELLNGSQELIAKEIIGTTQSDDIWRTIQNGESWTGLLKNVSKSGEAYIVHATITPILNDERQVSKYVAVLYNLTENVNRAVTAEEKLREYKNLNESLSQELNQLSENNRLLLKQEQQHQVLLNALHQSVWIAEMDLNGKIIYANDLFNRHAIEFSTGEVIGNELLPYFNSDFDSIPSLNELLALPQGSILTAIWGWGTYHVLQTTIVPVFNELGEIIRFIGIWKDVSAFWRKTSEEKAHYESEMLSLSNILADLQDYNHAYKNVGLQVELTAEGNIFSFNPAFVERTGYSLDEVSHLPFVMMLSEGSELTENYFSEGKSWSGTLYIRSADGQSLPMSAFITPVYKKQVLHRYLVLLIEGGELIRYVEKLKSENLQLRKEEQEFQLQNNFLQNELQQERENYQRLAEEKERLQQQLNTFASEKLLIDEEIKHLRAVSDQMDDLKAKWQEEIQARLSLQEQNEALKIQIDHLSVEQEKLRQVEVQENQQLKVQIATLQSQVAEARKMAEEYKSDESSLRLKWHQTIADISLLRGQVEKLEALLHEQTTQKELAEAKIAEYENQISLKVETTSPVEEPVISDNHTSVSLQEDHQAETPPKPLSIILVQGDAGDLAQSEQTLQGLGHHIVAVQYGREAIENYESRKPDMILLEIKLPDLNGFDLTDMIRTDYEDSKTRIYALVEESHAVYQNDYLANGFTGILVKPLQAEALQSVL